MLKEKFQHHWFCQECVSGGKKSAILNSGNEICGCRLQNVWPSLGRVLLHGLYFVLRWQLLLREPYPSCLEGLVLREITHAKNSALILYFISAFSGCRVKRKNHLSFRVLKLWSCCSCHGAPLFCASQEKVGLMRWKEKSGTVPLIKYKLLTALRPAYDFPWLLLESPFQYKQIAVLVAEALHVSVKRVILLGNLPTVMGPRLEIRRRPPSVLLFC